MDRGDLIGHEWEVVEIDGAPVTLERLPTLAFNEDGRISGSTGVNRLMGGYTLDGSRLALSQMATTMMAGLPEAAKVEANLVQALGGGGEIELQLVVRNPDTGAEVRLRRAAPSEAGPGTATGAVPVQPGLPPAAGPEPGSAVRGSVFYRERITMPEGAVVIVLLLDVSRADGPAEAIGEQVIEHPPNVPVPFEIAYDPSAIDESHAYAIAARIEVNGQLAWISDEHHPVLTRGGGDVVDVMVRRGAGEAG